MKPAFQEVIAAMKKQHPEQFSTQRKAARSVKHLKRLYARGK